MSTQVDLSQLAIDRSRSSTPSATRGWRWLTRYLLPALLLAGFAALVAWGVRDGVFPPRRVTVIPVLATQAAVQQEGTPLFKAAGWIEPRPTPHRVAALAPGVVEKLLVVEDQLLAAGDVVAELVKADAQLAVDRAQADHDLTTADLAKASAGLQAATTRFEQPVHLAAAVAEAEAALAKLTTELKNLPFETRRAQAQLDFAKQNYENKLAARDAVPQRNVLEAQSELASARALVDELHGREASLAQERTAMAARRAALAKQLELLIDERQAKDAAAAEVKAAEARVEQTRVALAQAELQRGRMTVRAPIAGRVYELVSTPGTTLAGNMPKSEYIDTSTVITMYCPDMLQVRVDVRFEDLPKISRSQAVRIDNPALQEPLAGEVLFIGSEADIQKNTLPVKVGIAESPPVFKPEMLVDVTFLAPRAAGETASEKSAMKLFLPRALIERDEQGEFVWVADQFARVARRTRITTTPGSAGDMVEVASGLTIASRLIDSGREGLSDGERIEITGEAATARADHPQARANRSRLPAGGHD